MFLNLIIIPQIYFKILRYVSNVCSANDYIILNEILTFLLRIFIQIYVTVLCNNFHEFSRWSAATILHCNHCYTRPEATYHHHHCYQLFVTHHGHMLINIIIHNSIVCDKVKYKLINHFYWLTYHHHLTSGKIQITTIANNYI